MYPPREAEPGAAGAPPTCAAASVGESHDGSKLVLYVERPSWDDDDVFAWTRGLQALCAQASTAYRNALSHESKDRRIEAANEALRRIRTTEERRSRFHGLIGSSTAMHRLYERIEMMAPNDSPVLIHGETGTGKEIVARVLHEKSKRSEAAFVAVNCAGLPDSLLESELFGYEKGAFTGASTARAGLFEVANHGTLFLDEIGEMSPRMQGTLLRALQSGETRRLGAPSPMLVDVRIIAATHRNLEELISDGEFRSDLYYRLGVLKLDVPPLRDRGRDIVLLLGELTARHRGDDTPPTIAPKALETLLTHSWPGNVRELDNLAQRLAVLDIERVEREHLGDVGADRTASPRRGTLREMELTLIRETLEEAGGNKTEAARTLGITRKTLLRKLRGAGES